MTTKARNLLFLVVFAGLGIFVMTQITPGPTSQPMQVRTHRPPSSASVANQRPVVRYTVSWSKGHEPSSIWYFDRGQKVFVPVQVIQSLAKVQTWQLELVYVPTFRWETGASQANVGSSTRASVYIQGVWGDADVHEGPGRVQAWVVPA